MQCLVFFLDSSFGGIKSQSMRLREGFVRSRSEHWYELFTRVVCTGKTHGMSLQIMFTFLWVFIKVHYVKRNENIFQTVSCEGCDFKKHDCLHMQWILKVHNKTVFLAPQTLSFYWINTASNGPNDCHFMYDYFVHWFSLTVFTTTGKKIARLNRLKYYNSLIFIWTRG